MQSAFDRFRLISRLGAGGMGEAFRAWDTEQGVPVVLKRPLPVYAGRSDVLQRFDREIQRLLELQHTHIVPIVAHGHDRSGMPFLAMRFLPGGSLADRARPQAAAYLHKWLPGIASALDFVHSNGVLHRDVKPGNVFFDAKGSAYLGDFGIAKVIEDEITGASEESLTNTSDNIGTSAYMGPEFFSQPRVLSGAYDQYALGITVYEMICGKRPFSGDSGQLIVAHVTQKPDDIRVTHPDAPVAFCEAVSRSLLKNPKERFSSCSQFVAEALQDIPLPLGEDNVFRFLCPACHKLVKVPEQFGGRDGRCTKCNAKIRVSANMDALWLRQEDSSGSSFADAREHDPKTVLTEMVPRTELSEPPPEKAATSLVLAILAPVSALVIIVCATIAIVAAVRNAQSLARAREARDWATILKFLPEDPDALLGRAVSQMAEPQPDFEAIFRDLDAARIRHPLPSEVNTAMADAHSLKGKFLAVGGRLEEAEKELDAAAKRGAGNETLAAGRAAIANKAVENVMTALGARDTKGAIKALDMAEKHGNDQDRLRSFRVRLFMLQAEQCEDRGERANALALVARALQLDVNQALGLLGQFSAGEFKVAAYEGHFRRQFDAAFAASEWNQVVKVIAGARSLGIDGWPWFNDAIRSQPDTITRLPSAIFSQLPLSTYGVMSPASPGEVPSLVNSIGMQMRLIPAGSFDMGNLEADGGKLQGVSIRRNYFIGSYEVTNAEWRRVMGGVPSRWKDLDRPVERVTWSEANEFCRKLSAIPDESVKGRVYRLPTEAEWEYACRAGTRSRYSFDDSGGMEVVHLYGWFASNSGLSVIDAAEAWQSNSLEKYAQVIGANGCQTHPVGRKKPNPWGVYDMHGNVWEWCSDWFSDYTPGPTTDPQGPPSGTTRVFRGGCWFFAPDLAGSGYRISGKEAFRRDDLGFRVVFAVVDAADMGAQGSAQGSD